MTEAEQQQPPGASASLITVQHVYGESSGDYNAIIISDGVDTVRLDLEDFAQIIDALFGDNGLLSDSNGEVAVSDEELAAIEQQFVQPDKRLVVKRSSRPSVE